MKCDGASSVVFRKVDTLRNGQLDMTAFKKFLHKLLHRPDIDYLFETLVAADAAGGGVGTRPGASILKGHHWLPFTFETKVSDIHSTSVMTSNSIMPLSAYLRFQKEVQGNLTMTKEQARRDLLLMEASTGPDRVSSQAFARYLVSRDNEVMDPSKANHYQEMTHPLSHYWIATSHNTYLEGDQLTSHSSINRYIDDLHKVCADGTLDFALELCCPICVFLESGLTTTIMAQQGCRCVELDCWDSEDQQPMITHGHTLTSCISLEGVLNAIKKHAFKTSDYPVILSIENHCSVILFVLTKTQS